MKLTIQQALRLGITAHKEGKLQEAERLYRAILQSQPGHPDANHNLGMIAVSVNETAAALPLFKTALEANPRIEQFWLSYVDALIKEKQFETARLVIEQAKTQGVAEKKLDVLETKIVSIEKQDTFDDFSPSQKQLNSLLEHFQNGRLEDAENLAIAITQDFPRHQFAWKVLGSVFTATGRMSEAVKAKEKAIRLAPNDAESHNNLGNTLQELGRLDDALASFRQAIALKPEFAEAHSNLGITLKELGRFDGALASHKQAIALKPDFAKGYSNFGVTLQELGRLDEALTSYTQAIMFEPDYAEALVNLGITVKKVKFNSSNPKLYPPLTMLLTAGNFSNPQDVAGSILSLLKQDPQIKYLLQKKNSIVSIDDATYIIEILDKLPLLHHLMRLCPLPELQFEGLFVAVRSLLLKNLDKMEASPKLIYFLSTLSLHCFTNEYVYVETYEETHLIEELQANISQIFAQSKQPVTLKVLCLASYRPLHQYDWCQKLESLDNLKEVKKRLIEEPFLEKVIAQDIPVLAEISDNVSLKVREQYEANPYPRWIKLRVPAKAKSIAAVCEELELRICSYNIQKITAPFILVAGCGTGRHSIGTALRFLNCHVNAVDLSLASLAYAQRKSTELNLVNIEYFQADILHLHQMGKEFDIIESAGVLHHMDDPMAGWRVLVDLLKPGGLMKIGLYSELARRHIVKAKREISSRGIGISANEIRNFRDFLKESEFNDQKKLISTWDFFTLSEFRDLLFHVQEHRFTLPQIKNCLDELGLKFCGFETKDVDSKFRELHGHEADIYDLQLWHQFEEKYPQAFSGMYQFWCQKP